MSPELEKPDRRRPRLGRLFRFEVWADFFVYITAAERTRDHVVATYVFKPELDVQTIITSASQEHLLLPPRLQFPVDFNSGIFIDTKMDIKSPYPLCDKRAFRQYAQWKCVDLQYRPTIETESVVWMDSLMGWSGSLAIAVSEALGKELPESQLDPRGHAHLEKRVKWLAEDEDNSKGADLRVFVPATNDGRDVLEPQPDYANEIGDRLRALKLGSQFRSWTDYDRDESHFYVDPHCYPQVVAVVKEILAKHGISEYTLKASHRWG